MTREQSHRILALLGEPALHPGVRDDRFEKARDDLDDALRALGRYVVVDVLESALAQRPDDLDQELVARSDPAVERGAVDAELIGERTHLYALRGQELPPREPERVEMSEEHTSELQSRQYLVC